MRKRIFTIVILLMLTLVLGINTTPVAAMSLKTFITSEQKINVTVTINGLEQQDIATLLLSPEMDESNESVIAQKIIVGNGSTIITNFSFSVKDGNYQLVLATSDKYYRDPKGYLFKVKKGNMVNVNNRSIMFELIPTEKREFISYRELTAVVNTSEYKRMLDETPVQIESFIALSLPSKSNPSSKNDGYHYTGVQTCQDNKGVWGKMDVVNCGVQHDLEYSYEFVCNRVYAYDNSNHWMEVGWIEDSQLSDYRYLYEYNSTSGDYRIIFNISTSTLEVRVHQYSSTTWEAEWYNGSSWIRVGIEDIGFSTATGAQNIGEIVTTNGSHPNLPTCYTTVNKLNVDSQWDNWDDSYDTDVIDNVDPPYRCYVNTEYTNFYLYTQ